MDILVSSAVIILFLLQGDVRSSDYPSPSIASISVQRSSDPQCWPFTTGIPTRSAKQIGTHPFTSQTPLAKAYPKNINCIKLIAASSPKYRIHLVLEAGWHIEDSDKCKYDSLTIQDGPFLFSRTIALICGQGPQRVFVSSGQYMRLVFKTDNYIQKSGMTMSWTEREIKDEDELSYLPCYFYIPITGKQGELEISHTAISKFYHNASDIPETGVDCVWDVHKRQDMESIWIWLWDTNQMIVENCTTDRVLEVYSVKNGLLYENNPRKYSKCYPIVFKLFPGSSRALIRLYARKAEMVPVVRINFTTFEEPLQSLAKCSSETLYTCQDGRLCLDDSLVCNELFNCPDGDDESEEACEAKNGRGWTLQLIFIGASLMFLVVVIAVLICSARRVLRRHKKLEKKRQEDSMIIANLRPLRLLQMSSIRLLNDGLNSPRNSIAIDNVNDNGMMNHSLQNSRRNSSCTRLSARDRSPASPSFLSPERNL